MKFLFFFIQYDILTNSFISTFIFENHAIYSQNNRLFWLHQKFLFHLQSFFSFSFYAFLCLAKSKYNSSILIFLYFYFSIPQFSNYLLLPFISISSSFTQRKKYNVTKTMVYRKYELVRKIPWCTRLDMKNKKPFLTWKKKIGHEKRKYTWKQKLQMKETHITHEKKKSVTHEKVNYT